MTASELRRRLMDQIEDEAARIAAENGRARSRELDEYRFQAGLVAGLELAHGMLEQSIRNQDEETESV